MIVTRLRPPTAIPLRLSLLALTLVSVTTAASAAALQDGAQNPSSSIFGPPPPCRPP